MLRAVSVGLPKTRFWLLAKSSFRPTGSITAQPQLSYADNQPVMNPICVCENCRVLGPVLVPGESRFWLSERYYFSIDLFRVKHITH